MKLKTRIDLDIEMKDLAESFCSLKDTQQAEFFKEIFMIISTRYGRGTAHTYWKSVGDNLEFISGNEFKQFLLSIVEGMKK